MAVADRKIVLSITLQARDLLRGPLRAARFAFQQLNRVGRATFAAIRAGARLAGAAIRTLLGPIGIILGALSGFALVRFVQMAAKAGDEVEKMGRRLGFAAETLSELRFAADLSGTSLSSLEKGIRRLQKNVLEAGQGLTTPIRAFEALGLSWEELQGLEPEALFLRVAESLAEVEDMTTRVGLAQQLFGRAGTELLPILDRGVEGLREMREEARRLGVTFDQVGAERAAAFVDAVTRLRGALAGLRNVIFVELAPVLTAWLNELARWIATNRDALGESAKRWAQWSYRTVEAIRLVGEGVMAFGQMLAQLARDQRAAEAFGQVLREMGELALGIAREAAIGVIRVILNLFQALVSPMVGIFSAIGRSAGGSFVAEVLASVAVLPLQMVQTLTEGTAALAQAAPATRPLLQLLGLTPERVGLSFDVLETAIRFELRDLLTSTEEEIETVEGFVGAAVQGAIANLSTQLSDAGVAVGDALDGVLGEFSGFLDDLGALADQDPAIAAFVAKLEELRVELGELKTKTLDVTTATGSALRTLSTDFAGVAEELADVQLEAFPEGLTGLQGPFTEEELRTGVRAAIESGEEALGFLERLGQGVANSVGGVVDSLLTGTQSLRDALAQVLSTILQIAAQAALRALFPGAGAAAFLARGGLSEAAVPIESFATGGVGRGGILRRPTLFLAGEGRQREAFVPLPDGRAIPAVVSEPDGASGMTVNLTIQAMDGQSVMQTLSRPEAQSVIVNQITAAMQQNRQLRTTTRHCISHRCPGG